MKKLTRSLLLVALFVSFINVCNAQVENHCLRLSEGGSVDCGPMPELNGATVFTVQFWFNADAWTEGAVLMSRGADFRVTLGAGNKLVINARGKEISVSNAAFTTGKWFPVMILSQPSRIQVYVSNSLARNVTTTGTLSDIGDRFILGGGSYRGRIDELRVWNAELASDYEYFTYTTLNKWVPQLSNLVAYFKFDQPWCANVVDYKPLFVTNAKTNHHGVLSDTGAVREKVTDNQDGLPYLLMGGYTDNKRFFDSAIERDKYLLSNDLIILGLQSWASGHVTALTPNDHATVRKGEYLSVYKVKKRAGVLSLSGQSSYIICPKSVFNPTGGFTLETWIYLEEWTEGGFIFKKENSAGTKGFSVRLGAEDTHQIIIRIDGRQYFYNNTKLTTGSWKHISITPGDGSSNRYTFFLNINGGTSMANSSQSDPSTDAIPTGMESLNFYIAQNLNCKLDETMVWHKTWDATDIEEHRNGNVPLPGPGKRVTQNLMDQTNAYYTYDYPDNLGFDLHSQDGWAKIMESCYDGYSGYQLRIAVQSHNNWQNTIADAEKRKIFAADLAELSKPYAGVELDLEWMDGTQTNLGLLADEILAVLPKGKTFMISMHQYGAYQFPKEKINNCDGYTFQQYGPNNKGWYSYSGFMNGYNAFVNYGYPKDKIYLSFSTTTTSGYDSGGSWAHDVIGYNWGLVGDSYVPATDGSTESGTWQGNTYYFAGPVQVYNRAKFVRDNQVMGLFYWDLCNDISPSSTLCLSRAANYALNANVDPRVDEVTVDHPTPVRHVTFTPGGTTEAQGVAYDLSGRRIDPAAPRRGIIIQNGRKIIR